MQDPVAPHLSWMEDPLRGLAALHSQRAEYLTTRNSGRADEDIIGFGLAADEATKKLIMAAAASADKAASGQLWEAIKAALQNLAASEHKPLCEGTSYALTPSSGALEVLPPRSWSAPRIFELFRSLEGLGGVSASHGDARLATSVYLLYGLPAYTHKLTIINAPTKVLLVGLTRVVLHSAGYDTDKVQVLAETPVTVPGSSRIISGGTVVAYIHAAEGVDLQVPSNFQVEDQTVNVRVTEANDVRRTQPPPTAGGAAPARRQAAPAAVAPDRLEPAAAAPTANAAVAPATAAAATLRPASDDAERRPAPPPARASGRDRSHDRRSHRPEPAGRRSALRCTRSAGPHRCGWQASHAGLLRAA